MEQATKKVSKSVAVLDMLASAGELGMRFTDIQEYSWELSHPGEPFTREQRGWWCTNLIECGRGRTGLLHVFAEKLPNGLWRRNSLDHEGHPWTVVEREAKRKDIEARERHHREVHFY